MSERLPDHLYCGSHPDANYWGVLLHDDLRQCDDCERVTDAGAFPDWANGSCEDCDPSVWDHYECEKCEGYPDRPYATHAEWCGRNPRNY